MPNITYEFKVDLALIWAVIISILAGLKWFLDLRAKQKERTLKAYEALFEDAQYIVQYPFRKRKNDAKKVEYKNANPDLERAVRLYIDSHWMNTFWSTNKYIPPSLRTETQKRLFMDKVRDEANRFQSGLSAYTWVMDLPDLSPVFYLDDPDVRARLTHVLDYVGQNLSAFSEKVRDYWDTASISDPEQIRLEYAKALQVCPHYFEHNPRDFDDPYYDITTTIVREYRKLVANKKQEFVWKFGVVFRRIMHPRAYLQARRKMNQYR
jgi:hypothetical protein